MVQMKVNGYGKNFSLQYKNQFRQKYNDTKDKQRLQKK